MIKYLNSFFEKKVDATGLSIFRMFYSIVLFFELRQIYTFRSIIYDKVPSKYVGEIDVSFIFYFWFVIVAFLFLGLFTRYITILNYIFGIIIFSSAVKFEYHVFYAYVGLNFLLIFMPVSRVLSLDNLIQKLKYSTLYKPFLVDRKVLKINYIVPVFVGIGLVYFDSIFHKLSSKMWMDGLGVWLPSSLPMVTWNDTSILLNQKWLILFLGYLVLVFEAVFLFLFLFKRFRVPFFLLGIFFHIGILIAYPIPWFALTFIAVYLLLVPVNYWRLLTSKIKCKNSIYTFYYDLECPLCNKVIIIIRHFDVFNTVACLPVQGNYKINEALLNYEEETLLINIHGVTKSGKVVSGFWAYVALLKAMRYTYVIGVLVSLPLISTIGQRIYNYIAGNRLTERCTLENCAIPVYTPPPSEQDDFLIKDWNRLRLTRVFWKFVILFLSFGQLLMIWFSPTVQNNFPKVNYFNRIVEIPYNNTNYLFKKYFGVTKHDVFLDFHFQNFNHIFRVEALTNDDKILDLPIINMNGNPCGINNGIIWRNVSFNMVTPIIEKSKIEEESVRYFLYFQKDKQVKIKKYRFFIKTIDNPGDWQKDFLKKQMNKPWQEVGEAVVEEDTFLFKWNERMEQILVDENHE